jgi:hypothetical protein
MNLKIFALLFSFFVLFAFFSGCAEEKPAETTPTPEPAETPAPSATPTPVPATPAPAPPMQTQVPIPADFQTKTFDVVGMSLDISFPSDWSIAGSSLVYGKNYAGTLTVSEQVHFMDCEKPFAECVQEKLSYVGWQEYKMESCTMPAVWRLSYEQENSIQKQLWIDFPDQKKGVMILCTAYYGEKTAQTCDKIMQFIKC